ncbi:hypothetical protein [Actinoplanes teichomyceticus]|uniref:UDP-N-acetylglucosamine:LPS N-acetylglucosamine transferase n=1 Tax=Actinoplanes teichomyceticus TaxID=1867 RepID=A0A561VIG9_ACTTI|nr:hypothetical protein [Actinoplanes teichomyceticus]TWG11413.1 hypothetical protein FHX34_106143 [Actinoplanes teichomyceticus]GIF15775.1 hypothetical protein Ate01nite_58070 [Actinoplanes teichomyceticus]
MIVCYAQGGGLGHLTRVRAYLHTVHADEPATVLTTSPFGADPRVLGPHRPRSLPPGADPAAVLRELRPDTLVVDAFPAGIRGELRAASVPPGTRTVHLARLLRWDAYRELLPPDPIRFDRTWTVEPVTGAHGAHLTRTSAAVAPLSLTDPPAGVGPDGGVAHGAWLILHSGPDAEIDELIGYARECAALEGERPRLVLAAPRRPCGLPDDVGHLATYPAWPLFERAARIVTAAGFNAVRQAAPWRAKHRMLPFPRRWDDQFTRAARARREVALG